MGDGEGAGLPHLEKPRSAVGAHAGEQYAHGVPAGVFGHRLEEFVYRRALEMAAFALVQLHQVAGAASAQHHVVVAGGDEHHAGHHRIAVLAFPHFHLAESIQTIGEGLGEACRHVLGNHGGRAVGREIYQHVLNGAGAAGGSADGQDLVRRLEERLADGFHGAGGAGYGATQKTQAREVDASGGADLLGQHRNEISYGVGGARLAKYVDGTGRKRLHGHLAALGGK